MSMRESNEPGMPGYFLPEDGQVRLAKLRDCMGFLSRLAQPRTRDEAREWVPEVRVNELAICLELLAEQADFVLQEMSWQASREAVVEAPEPDARAASTQESPDDASEGVVFGVSLGQIDALDRLIRMISAHGDVVAAGLAAELADRTLPVLGQAIHDGAAAVRDILDQVEAQRLGRQPRSRGRVGEERGVYGGGLAWLGVEGSPCPALLPRARDKNRGQGRLPRRYVICSTALRPSDPRRPSRLRGLRLVAHRKRSVHRDAVTASAVGLPWLFRFE